MDALRFLIEHWEAITGVTGWIVGIAAFIWTRKESRLVALEGVLRPLLEAAQALNSASECRRKCEAIRRSYPDAKATPDAVQSHNNWMGEYGKYLEISAAASKAAEREFGATQFRYPDRVARMLNAAVKDIAQAGQYLNDGHTELVDVQIAKVKDHYRAIGKYARGLRLYDPIEGIKQRFQRPQDEEAELVLTKDEVEQLSMLALNRFLKHGGRSYVVHPPKCLIDDPSIQDSDDLVEKLQDSVFEVVFQDGSHHLMGLPQLLFFTHSVIFFAVEGAKAMEAAEVFDHPVNLSLTYGVAPQELMRPEMAKLLLSKIDFSDEPSDGT